MAAEKSVIEAYIDAQSAQVQPRLRTLYSIIRESAPGASEKIGYGMPTFKMKRNLIHFAAHDRHIGLYPGPDAIEAFAKELAGYKTSKGTIQLPLDKPLDEALVRRIVAYNVKLQAP